jgi:hypothetical protein
MTSRNEHLAAPHANIKEAVGVPVLIAGRMVATARTG